MGSDNRRRRSGAGLVWLTYTFIRVAKSQLKAEERLQLAILVCEAIGDHLEANGYTRWPRSWDELAVSPPREWGQYRWPDDVDKIRQFVIVDFAADLDAVAAATPATFTAVQPNGVCYEVWRGHAAEPLLARLRAGLRDAARPTRPGTE